MPGALLDELEPIRKHLEDLLKTFELGTPERHFAVLAYEKVSNLVERLLSPSDGLRQEIADVAKGAGRQIPRDD